MTKSRDVRSIQTKLIKASECMSEVFVRYEKLSKELQKWKQYVKGFEKQSNKYRCLLEDADDTNEKLKDLIRHLRQALMFDKDLTDKIDEVLK